jgi:hypothetical protein
LFLYSIGDRKWRDPAMRFTISAVLGRKGERKIKRLVYITVLRSAKSGNSKQKGLFHRCQIHYHYCSTYE